MIPVNIRLAYARPGIAQYTPDALVFAELGAHHPPQPSLYLGRPGQPAANGTEPAPSSVREENKTT